MSCITCLGDNFKIKPNGFEEILSFSEKCPYNLFIKYFEEVDNVRVHYAKTVEILFCEDLIGNMFIENDQYELGGNQLFIIPPYTIHRNIVQICSGVMYVLKLSINDFMHYINIDSILGLKNCSIDQLEHINPNYDTAKKILDNIIKHDDDLSLCLVHIMELLQLLADYKKEDKELHTVEKKIKTSELQSLINWTQTHFSEKITLDDIAKISGYSKQYFCSRFKDITGITYMNYLNNVRISNACLLLKDGRTIQEVSNKCGFENTAYFIQVFKKIEKQTPHQYAKQNRVNKLSEQIMREE